MESLHFHCAHFKMQTAIIVAILVLVVVEMTAAKRQHHCKLPVDRGHHCNRHSARERIYYDRAARKCKPFNYRGCGGNKNRFKSHHDCRKECS
ncbi:Protease inhibitor LmKTT-1b [Mizuhopecten yessoensis]|uniref:Protease inhibitor LmKTT-1b n=1 Tax=Mizuhopecten yessoensis TaxID=6573 RepID=A0A210PSB0_MIZYE|nr:Protease inhibitor LmKTT-1b [Mizuhopecten yessoensis]